ncbi:N-acetylglucosamine-6-phosphate deacetylase [Fimbriiglobus ruber]|uniref:N-acetylglucosamine-6-phosphate deacetylase n=1 Tax=Fimbriiglobus ruber TaxID=1908690 RepID=A0A225DVN0_9BACT|nr:amidohydrolase family protein [Fimbriiglobus ruber]OWK41259.1 N-acetylglucosamine-6-phosphate deacetylase [Fimbriiglobus ruber]
MSTVTFLNATLVLPDRLLNATTLTAESGRIRDIGRAPTTGGTTVDLGGAYLCPGFIDLHVHGGDGADFMDLTPAAFEAVCRCHARHGTTALTPTSTVATYEQYLGFLRLCERFTGTATGGARVLGGHLYGPYFLREAKGCHPDAEFLTPDPARDDQLLAFAGRGLVTLTVAPETPGTERLVRAARAAGLLVTAGHSYATFSQLEAAIGWGVRHADHLFCAMSDRARLRPTQTYPMRGGVLEAILYFDEMTSEVIADGKHLTADLLRLAYKVKGSDRLCLVTDTMRAVDCPDGEYWFGPDGSGELVRRMDDVGVTRDGKALASGVMGMDHCLRTFHRLTGAPLHEAVRMATLTPARILGVDAEYGSLEVGKAADLIVLDAALTVKGVYVGGEKVA